MVKGKRLGIILAVALAALLLFAACAPAPIVEQRKTMGLAAILPITGSTSANCIPELMGAQDYVRYFNEQEPIPGVSLELLWGDTALSDALFLSFYEKFKARGVPLIYAIEPYILASIKPRLPEDNIVVEAAGISTYELVYDKPGWVYCSGPTGAEQIAPVLDYFMENWKESRPPRFACMHIPGAFGEEPLPEITKYALSLGFEVLPDETVPYVILDATTELLRLETEGADLVYLKILGQSYLPVLRDAERLGLVPQMRFGGPNSGMYESVIQGAGDGGESYIVGVAFPWIDETEVPGIKLIVDKQMEYHGKVLRDLVYITGWVDAAIMCEAIKRAVENVGYDNVDGAAVKQAFDSMEDFDVDGICKVTYKDRPFDHRGVTKMAVYEGRGGNFVRVTDWKEVPSLVPEGLVRE